MRSCGTSLASTTCAAAPKKRWSGLTWLRNKLWTWGESKDLRKTWIWTLKLDRYKKHSRSWRFLVCFAGTMLFTSFMTGLVLKQGLVSFCPVWVLRTQKTNLRCWMLMLDWSWIWYDQCRGVHWETSNHPQGHLTLPWWQVWIKKSKARVIFVLTMQFISNLYFDHSISNL